MPDPVTGAEALDPSLHSPAGEPSAGQPAANAASGKGGALAVGRRWHNYTVKSELPGPPAGCFVATDVSVMQDVVIQMRPVGAEDDGRREVWRILQELPEENFTPTSEAREEDGFRYEIFPVPTGQSLREWLGAHRTNAATIELGMQQLAQGIEALHEAGLVHLNLRPETIFIEEGNDHQLKVMIGGLHKAQLTGRSGLVDIEANPYYAPPEAGGLFRHEAGNGLRAWDWWALGRIIQEMVLGRHVYSLVMERDVRANPPELRARAEALLLERDVTSLRAGAVELLPDDTSPRLRQILRGLLASVRDGRWRWPQVEAWLRGDQPVDRYDLPRNTRLILRGEQALTLAETADLYVLPAHFAEGAAQLFPSDGATESVWGILQETPQFRTELDRVRPLRDMVNMPPWQGQPVAMCQAAVSGLVWLTLASSSPRKALCFAGHVINVAGLRRLFRENAAIAEATLAVLTAEPYLQRVSPLDPTARKALDLLAKTGREAVALAKTHGLAFVARPEGLAKLLEWSLASDTELQANRDSLRTRYAASSDTRLDASLQAPKPTRAELALLAATGENPGPHGYITHEEWTRRRHAELMARTTQVSGALFWRRLERLIVFAPALLGFWPVSAAIWLVPLALTLAAHAWVLAGLTAFAAVAARVGGMFAVRRLVARAAPGRPPWLWVDQTTRCRREVFALLPGEKLPSVGQLKAEMARIRQELGRLTLPAGLARPAAPARFNALETGAALAMAAPVVVLALVVGPHLPLPGRSAPGRTAAAAHPVAPEPETLVQMIGPDGKPGLYEIVNDGFGGYRRGPLKLWDVPKPATPATLKITDQTTASGEQRAFAVVSAELLLAPYPRQGPKVLVAVAVPRRREARPSIVLYDSATRRLADGWSYGVGSDLTPATWYNLTGREVVYLGLPGTMQGDDLIPLP